MRTLPHSGHAPSRVSRARPPKVGRPSGAFTQHRRIDRLRDVLENEPRGLTLEDLSRLLRITQRSVRRYLKELGELTQLENVETVRGGAHLWRIKPSERGRAVSLRRAQAYAILATRRALDVLKGSALYDEVDIALGHIEKIAQTPFRAQGKAEISGERGLEGRFFWLPPTARTYAARGEDLDELFRAVADLRVLHFRVRGAKSDRIAFHPYAMIVHKGSIAVLGVRAGANVRDVDVFAFESLSELGSSETEHFDLPASFDVSTYIHGEFGLGRPGKGRVIVEFDARVADEIRAKKLHRDQKLATAPDGRVRVSLPLVNPDNMIAWVLSWGEAARIVEPPELVRHVAEKLERAALRYR